MTNAKQEPIDPVRISIEVAASYIVDYANEDIPPWCVEATLGGCEPEFQGWGPDALAAALDLGAVLYAAILHMRAHRDGDHAQLTQGCPDCTQQLKDLLREGRSA